MLGLAHLTPVYNLEIKPKLYYTGFEYLCLIRAEALKIFYVPESLKYILKLHIIK